MARGIKRHMKRVNAPSHWMLGKLNGVWAPKPTAGPHKLRECMPLIVLLRNRLKYALTNKEVIQIVKQRLIKVDDRVRTESRYPTGLMDVITIDKTKENFRMLMDLKGRFVVHKIHKDEASYKMCKVLRVGTSPKGVPHIVTHDGRTIRYPDPEISRHDSVRVDLKTGHILDFVKFEMGNCVMVTAGNNSGRVGTVTLREKHQGGFDMVHCKDANDNSFVTRLQNVLVIGKGDKPWVSLPKGNGIKLTIAQDQALRMAKQRR